MLANDVGMFHNFQISSSLIARAKASLLLLLKNTVQNVSFL